MLFGTTDRRSNKLGIPLCTVLHGNKALSKKKKNKLGIQEYSGTGPKKFRSEHVSEHLDSLSRITWTREPGTKCSQVVTRHTP